jgi:hypothetical protein
MHKRIKCKIKIINNYAQSFELDLIYNCNIYVLELIHFQVKQVQVYVWVVMINFLVFQNNRNFYILLFIPAFLFLMMLYLEFAVYCVSNPFYNYVLYLKILYCNV